MTKYIEEVTGACCHCLQDERGSVDYAVVYNFNGRLVCPDAFGLCLDCAQELYSFYSKCFQYGDTVAIVCFIPTECWDETGTFFPNALGYDRVPEPGYEIGQGYQGERGCEMPEFMQARWGVSLS